ncbi:MAG: adenylate/guanylate cyclase domain-containing protein [Anaerolineales bacterium]|nr:adenylate/guanylate cyclase domain-containing protein [Anaerolineales bacterium]
MSDDKSEADQMWHDWFMTDAFKVEKQLFRVFRFLPHDPRCKICYSPFSGLGGTLMRTLLGRKQSTLNPFFCNVCEDFAKKHPGGSEVEMSMLFVDVRGSTALSEQMTVTEFRSLINRFFIESTNAIAKEDGLVEKLAGDAVAAFWGAGFAGPDYVARTIRAAQNILKIMNREKIPVGIGVHAGAAYFGAMGSADGLVNISAIGDEVNTAARLASKAAAGEIIISERALERAGIDGNGFESRVLELKGISEPVTVRVVRA